MSTVTNIEMPVINLTATKVRIDQKIKEYNDGKPLIEQIRGYHFDTLWRIVEHFAFKIRKDNKRLHPNLRRVNLERPDRILWTSKLTRENIREWLRVSSVQTVTNRLSRLAEAGFLNIDHRAKDNKHLTSIIALNKDIIALEDALDDKKLNHSHISVKSRSKQLIEDVNVMKKRFAENQEVNPSKDESFVPLLNNTKHNRFNNKLMQKGAISEKSEIGVEGIPNSSNSANLLPRTPKQGILEDTHKANRAKYAEKIVPEKKRNRYEVYAAQTDAEKLEDYRRSCAEYVFRKSLDLWKHRTDVYDGEYRRAGQYVVSNYFKKCETIKQIKESVKMILWCINFQLSQRKSAKMKDNKEQFVFYPMRYFSGHGTGTLSALKPFYVRYKQGHEMPSWQRAAKKIKPTKRQKNYKKEFVAISKYVEGFLSGKRNLKALARYEALIKKEFPNQRHYLDQFNQMISSHFVH